MQKNQPPYLLVLLFICGLLSSIIAHFHLFIIHRNWAKVPTGFIETPDGSYSTIRKIWLVRMMKRSLSLLLRTPLRRGPLRLVNCKLTLPIESGCVIVICHTPWARLLAEWCRVNDFSLIFAGGGWIQRTGKVNVPGGGFTDLRRLIQHLHSGGRVIVIGDNLGGFRSCSIDFLGKDFVASILPARIAALAGVPMLTSIPKFQDGKIHLHNGLTIGIEEVITDQRGTIQRIFTFFESEILLSPSNWLPYIRYSLNHMNSWEHDATLRIY